MFNLYHTERMVRDGIYRREKEDLLRVEHAKKEKTKVCQECSCILYQSSGKCPNSDCVLYDDSDDDCEAEQKFSCGALVALRMERRQRSVMRDAISMKINDTMAMYRNKKKKTYVQPAVPFAHTFRVHTKIVPTQEVGRWKYEVIDLENLYELDRRFSLNEFELCSAQWRWAQLKKVEVKISIMACGPTFYQVFFSPSYNVMTRINNQFSTTMVADNRNDNERLEYVWRGEQSQLRCPVEKDTQCCLVVAYEAVECPFILVEFSLGVALEGMCARAQCHQIPFGLMTDKVSEFFFEEGKKNRKESGVFNFLYGGGSGQRNFEYECKEVPFCKHTSGCHCVLVIRGDSLFQNFVFEVQPLSKGDNLKDFRKWLQDNFEIVGNPEKVRVKLEKHVIFSEMMDRARGTVIWHILSDGAFVYGSGENTIEKLTISGRGNFSGLEFEVTMGGIGMVIQELKNYLVGKKIDIITMICPQCGTKFNCESES